MKLLEDKIISFMRDLMHFDHFAIRLLDRKSNKLEVVISQGLPPEASRHKVWVARRTPDNHAENIMPVDWIGVSQKGLMATNYQLLPGDRVYVKAQTIQRLDTGIARVLSPIQRLLGAVLLGSETVNSIRGVGSVR